MIQHTFQFLDSIRSGTEKNIWKQGILSWDAFIRAKSVKGVSAGRKAYYDRQLRQAKNELYSMNSSHFLSLPQAEMWRLYQFFRDEAIFLDIEATGVNKHDQITVVGLFDGIETKVMIKDVNLDIPKLREELKRYKLIVTFNGSTFDIPYIKKRFPDLIPDIPHFDLRVACSRVGLKGGLKEIEKTLGIKRNKIIERLYGGDALTLYRMFRGSGDDYYLKLLVEYNEEDVINLRQIADLVVRTLTYSALHQYEDRNGQSHISSISEYESHKSASHA